MKKFKSARTLKSMYDNNCIIIENESGEIFHLNVEEILKLVNDTNRPIFYNKKIKNTYITFRTLPMTKEEMEKVSIIFDDIIDNQCDDEVKCDVCDYNDDFIYVDIIYLDGNRDTVKINRETMKLIN